MLYIASEKKIDLWQLATPLHYAISCTSLEEKKILRRENGHFCHIPCVFYVVGIRKIFTAMDNPLGFCCILYTSKRSLFKYGHVWPPLAMPYLYISNHNNKGEERPYSNIQPSHAMPYTVNYSQQQKRRKILQLCTTSSGNIIIVN